jgi:adenylyl-sulfate kinase
LGDQSSLRQSIHMTIKPTAISAAQRQSLTGHPGHVVWFTGLSGSGKSTLAVALESALYGLGIHTYLLDGDQLRQGLNRDLGFSSADRAENIRRSAEVARLMCDAGLVVLAAFISPFEAERELARRLVGPAHFLQVYVSTPLVTCEARDTKGLYQKARAGVLTTLTGIGSPYEAPTAPDITLDTTDLSVNEATAVLLKRLLTALGKA